MRPILELLGHILRMSSRRDRTEINIEMLEAMEDLFHPGTLTLYRCYENETSTTLFKCAGFGNGDRFCRNAYLPDPRFCTPIDVDPFLRRCRQENSLIRHNVSPGLQRLVVPVAQNENLFYLIDATLPEDFPPEQWVVLMGLTEFFGKHIALLDYGETDTLTGLANRKTFDKHLFEVLGSAMNDECGPHDVARARRHGDDSNGQHWLAVCDVDRFKSINDTHGHLMGDEVLVVLAQLMRRSMRLADQLFRFGGEEFVIVLQPTSAVNALQVFDRFRRTVETHPFSRVGHATISIGFTRLLATDTPPDVIDRADEALYYAKEHGRNQVASYEELVSSGKHRPNTVDRGGIELF
jgi:diguanylate cyclase (GGDEF)-like protein